MGKPLNSYWHVLATTILLELLVVLLWRRITNEHQTVLFFAVAGVNLISHPAAWLAVNQFPAEYWWIEVSVVLFEAIAIYLLAPIRFPSAILLSTIANLTTAMLGWLYFGPTPA